MKRTLVSRLQILVQIYISQSIIQEIVEFRALKFYVNVWNPGVFVRTRINLNHGVIISVAIGFLTSPLLVRLFVTDYEMLSSQCVAEYNERCTCADDRGSTVYHLPEEASWRKKER